MKLAIFDMDGLLFDTERLTEKIMTDVLAKYNYTITHEQYIKCTGLTKKAYKAAMLEFYGSDYPYDTISKTVRKKIDETLRNEGCPIKDGIPELLEFLNKNNVLCVIASSTYTNYVKEYIELSGLSKYFTHIIGGDTVNKGKPEPDIFLKACDLAKVNPKDAIVFEDSENGIKASVNANIPVICIFDMKRHDKNIQNMCLTCVNNAFEAKKFLEELM